MNGHWNVFVEENLLQMHAGGFAGFDVGIRHKISAWAVFSGPTHSQSLFFWRPGLYEDVSLSRDLGFNATAELLVRCEKGSTRTMTMYRDCFAQRGLNLRIEILLDEKFDVISLRVFEYLLNGGEHGSRV